MPVGSACLRPFQEQRKTQSILFRFLSLRVPCTGTRNGTNFDIICVLRCLSAVPASAPSGATKGTIYVIKFVSLRVLCTGTQWHKFQYDLFHAMPVGSACPRPFRGNERHNVYDQDLCYCVSLVQGHSMAQLLIYFVSCAACRRCLHPPLQVQRKTQSISLRFVSLRVPCTATCTVANFNIICMLSCLSAVPFFGPPGATKDTKHIIKICVIACPSQDCTTGTQ